MDSDIGATATLVQQQHQTLDGNHHQGQKDNVNGTVESAEGHAVDRFRGEAGCSVKEIAVVAPDNDRFGDSSTQCNDVIDDDNEEEETDVEESGASGWIINPPVSTIVQQHQAFDTRNGYIALPNPDSSNFNDVRVKDSSNVHLGNEVNYNGPVTIHVNHVVYTNSSPTQDASKLDDNVSDNTSTNKDNGDPNGCIFQQNTKLNKVTQWLRTWKRAVLSCVITLILLAIVVPITVQISHQSDASDSLEIPTSSNEGSFLPSVRPTTGITQSPRTPAPTRGSGTPSDTNTCKAPPQPQNGRWKLHRSQDCRSDGLDCNVLEGTELGLGSYLVYSCDSGYKIIGSTDVSCSIGGKWLDIPICTAILCKALAASSIRTGCLYNDEWISCKSPVPPKTKATLSCEKSYRPETNLLSGQRTNVRCNANGEWEPEPMRCVPVCGTLPPDYKPTEYHVGDFRPNISEFPWHASMYLAEPGEPKKYFCGASIIQENLLITAAHCVYGFHMQPIEAHKIYILAGNLFLDYNNSFHHPILVKRNQVKRIYVKRNYLGYIGNYLSDIAILELITPFIFSSYLVPVCIDTLSYGSVLEPGTYGKVTGFGKTETGESSEVLQTLTVPVMSLSQCRSQSINSELFIIHDKFCAGHTNGSISSACDGDGKSGSGLVFKTNNLWYLRGIVSFCVTQKRGSLQFYTEISRYIPWIQDVMTKIEQNQTHTLCSEKSSTRCL